MSIGRERTLTCRDIATMAAGPRMLPGFGSRPVEEENEGVEEDSAEKYINPKVGFHTFVSLPCVVGRFPQ